MTDLPENYSGMSREEYDREMLKKAYRYSVCVFLGRGKFQTEYFEVKDQPELGLELARLYRNKILSDCPDLGTKPMIYGLVKSGGMDITIFVE